MCIRDSYFKIGMASNLATRWLMYRQPGQSWTPSPLGVLMAIEGRAAASMAESALIAMLASTDLPAVHNINWKHDDKGGTSPRPAATTHSLHFIYLAVAVA